MTLFIIAVTHVLVRHPIPGGRLTARIKDSQGQEVPSAQYEVSQDGEDFTFKFKKPHRSRSGKYTLVFSYDGVETEQDININFIGKFRYKHFKLDYSIKLNYSRRACSP